MFQPTFRYFISSFYTIALFPPTSCFLLFSFHYLLRLNSTLSSEFIEQECFVYQVAAFISLFSSFFPFIVCMFYFLFFSIVFSVVNFIETIGCKFVSINQLLLSCFLSFLFFWCVSTAMFSFTCFPLFSRQLFSQFSFSCFFLSVDANDFLFLFITSSQLILTILSSHSVSLHNKLLLFLYFLLTCFIFRLSYSPLTCSFSHICAPSSVNATQSNFLGTLRGKNLSPSSPCFHHHNFAERTSQSILSLLPISDAESLTKLT